MTSSVLDQAKAVGDAVLYEGYLLYPYRASAGKNRVRWQWGVLMPPSFASADAGEYASARAECLLEPELRTNLHVKLRFLQAQARLVHDGSRFVDTLTVDGVEHLSWDEAVEREVDVVVRTAELLAQPVETPFTVPGGEEVEDLGGSAYLLRRTQRLSGSLRLRLDALGGPFGGTRLRLEVVNTGLWTADAPTREVALHRAMVAAHVVLSVDSGHFLSMLDPPEWAKPAVESCVNERVWPVLIGDTERSSTMLLSPIILYDNPAIAEESQGELFDGTEIDEILTLRTMTLTDDEKRQARATDPRAAEIVDRVDAMPPELLDRLHGTVRYLRSVTGEKDESVVIGGVVVAAGSKVVLRPNLRRADAQDMFLVDRVATVRAVLSDVDGETHVAVTVDDDPAADLQTTHGRFRYFSPDELSPLEATE